MNCKTVRKKIVRFLANNAKESGCEGFVVGVSGGVDSALTSTLCAETGLPTLAITLPIEGKDEQWERGRTHQRMLENRYDNVETKNVDLTKPCQGFEPILEKHDLTDDLVKVNLQARLRMSALYAFSNEYSYLVAGTGNKVEDFGVGFFTKYGDGGVDLLPIADLYKTEVRELSNYLGISSEIIEAPPSDGLWEDNRTDEQQLGMNYKEIEECMEWHANEVDPNSSKLSEKERNNYRKYLEMHQQNKHKMSMPPVCDLSGVKE